MRTIHLGTGDRSFCGRPIESVTIGTLGTTTCKTCKGSMRFTVFDVAASLGLKTKTPLAVPTFEDADATK